MSGPSVQNLMRPAPVTVTQTESLAAARALMERERIRQLPVVENGALVGILSDRDLHAHAGYLEATKVDAAMAAEPLTVAPTDTAAHAARLLVERKVNALPVVDGARLVGIISRSDLLRLLVRLLEGG